MSPISRRKAVGIFAVFAFAYFLSALIRAITATLAPALAHEFSLNARDLGLLAGGYFLGFAATQLPLGKLLDRFGPKRVVTAFLAVAVVGCTAFAMASSFAGLLAARILCGVGVSACLMAPLTGYRRWFEPTSQMRANSWMLMVGAFGMVASTLPVQWLMPIVGWRPIFGILAAMVALSILMISLQVPTWAISPPNVVKGPTPGYSEIWNNRYFRTMAPIGFFNFGGLVAMQTLWAAPWMIKVAGYTPVQAATGLFWINVAMLLAFWLWGVANPWLTRRGYTAEKLIAYGMPLSIVAAALISLTGTAITTGSTAIWIAFCVFSTVGALAQPAVGMAFPAQAAGRALSAYNLVIFSGVFAVQWGFGLAIDGLRFVGWSEPMAFQGAMGFYTVCSLAAYLYFLVTKRP